MHESSSRPQQAERPVEVPLAGYVDRLSARPGETIEFKVSATQVPATVSARLTRSVCADPNPAGPGIVEYPADEWFSEQSFAARHQAFYPGSYAATDTTTSLADSAVVAFEAIVYPVGCCCVSRRGSLSCHHDGIAVTSMAALVCHC